MAKQIQAWKKEREFYLIKDVEKATHLYRTKTPYLLELKNNDYIHHLRMTIPKLSFTASSAYIGPMGCSHIYAIIREHQPNLIIESGIGRGATSTFILTALQKNGIDNNLSKLRGWALKGFKSFTEALGFRTKRITLIGGYCYGSKELIAPMEYDGYTNSEVFLSWVELALCQELKPNQVVVMDNASFHKSAQVKELIERAGCKLIYLPPYSPDLNPIEHVWANLKRCIRRNDNRQNNLNLAIEQSIAQSFMC